MPEVTTLTCPLCGSPMRLQRKSRYGPFYGCTAWPRCRATHGAHPDGSPLGIPADDETKRARIVAHAAFDRLWKGPQGRMRRVDAYRWLREAMGLSAEECHIGRFDKAQCLRVVAVVTDHLGGSP